MRKPPIPEEELLNKPIFPETTNGAVPSYQRVSTRQSKDTPVTIISGSYHGQNGVLIGKGDVYVHVRLNSGVRVTLFPEQVE